MSPRTRAASKTEFCDPKPKLEDRALLHPPQAEELADLFKVLGNGTRLRLLHALVRSGEHCVMELADAVGMKPQAVSNQLRRLVDRGVLGSRRNGINIYYRLVDPCIRELIDRGLCLSEDSKTRRKGS